MNKCVKCLNKAVDELEETNEWGGWEDLPRSKSEWEYVRRWYKG